MSSCSHDHSPDSLPVRILNSANPFNKHQTTMGGGKTQQQASAAEYPVLNFTPKGAQIRGIYESKIKNFTATGQYENVNLRAMFVKDRAGGDDAVKLEVWSVPDPMARPTFDEAKKASYKRTSVGNTFGPSWSTHWFRVAITVPSRMAKQERVQFNWDSNSEALVWTEDGDAVQGLTGGGERTEYIFPQSWKSDGKEHVFYVEMACNGMFGNANGDSIQPPNPNRYFTLSRAEISVPNLEALALHYDFWEIGDASREFGADTWEQHTATQVCNDIVNTFVLHDQSSITACRKIAQKYIGTKVDSADVYKTDLKPLVFATGHCHIDTAWLWPFDETKRKVARSWANQVNLMDMYPEHRFTCSSAQQYKWLEQLYPKLFERVKAKALEGKFQYIGGSWVEHDTNMPSGESLVRQFILGQRYFQSRFGERCTTFWLPDTFGYSAQLPQLCRLAGMTRFFTQKLSWNNINTFPHSTFNWISLDGSQVLCHMPPSETYTADANFGDAKRSMSKHKSLDQDNTSLLVFGKGDGGGGPLIEHIEKLRRIRGMADTTGLIPRITMGTSVDEFFANLEKKQAEGTGFVTWFGELYLEFHRGTYTTQARNKKSNRRSEVMMKDLEMLATFASLKNSSYKYPKQAIDDIWEVICLCQFHDCLPGSCIEMVYRDTDKMYADLFKKGTALIEEAAGALKIKFQPSEGSKPVAINTLPWERTELVTTEKDQFFVKSAPNGIGAQTATTKPVSGKEVSPGVFVLENTVLRATINKGLITSLVHVPTDREVVAPNAKGLNQLVIFDDKPPYWQAWDVEVYHTEQRREIDASKISLLSTGPEKATVLVEHQISPTSWMKTEISLTAAVGGNSGTFLEFAAEVEWQETMKFLKAEFPVDIYNTEASYECQYGILRRPTHYNTTWDMAKFEVVTQKWADLSENNFGLSVLNDCKYGFATAGNLMRISLLRAPKAPDAHADLGRHSFKYALLPHEGALGQSTVRTAAEFNNPMRVGWAKPHEEDIGIWSNASVAGYEGDKSIILDTIKRGEDDEDVSLGGLPVRKGRSVVVRLYESLGGKSRGVLKVAKGVKKVEKVNLLEDEGEEYKIEKGAGADDELARVKFTLRPYEVATFRVQVE